MIIPAHEPNAGIPPDSRFRSGSATSKAVASFHIVVYSPPGITSPSTAVSSSGRRTLTGVAPVCASARRCSTTSPCNARTPTTGTEPTDNLPDGSPLTLRVIATPSPAGTPQPSAVFHTAPPARWYRPGAGDLGLRLRGGGLRLLGRLLASGRGLALRPAGGLPLA